MMSTEVLDLSTYSTSTNDPSDTLFIHSSDHPKMKLVFKVLNGLNYALGKCYLNIRLIVKNKIEILKETVQELDESDPKHS